MEEEEERKKRGERRRRKRGQGVKEIQVVDEEGKREGKEEECRKKENEKVIINIITIVPLLTLGTHAPEGYGSCPVCVSVCVCVCPQP